MTTVGILSDVHMRAEQESAVRETLTGICEELRRRDPAHVFVLGDLIEDDRNPTNDRHYVSTVDNLLSTLPAPVTYLLGNHDTVNLSRDEVSALLGQDRFYGRLDVEGVPFVYLDTSRGNGRVAGEVGEGQRAWLNRTLPQGAVVLLHHPVGPFPLSGNAWFADAPARAFLLDQQETLDMLSGRARATVSGHIHQTEALQYRGVAHLSLNAISKETPDVPVSGTWALLDVDTDLKADIFVQDRHQQSFLLD